METSVATSKGQILIPKKLRTKYGIKPGVKVVFIEKNGELILKALNKEYFESFAGIWKDGPDLVAELIKEKQAEKKRDEKKLRF